MTQKIGAHFPRSSGRPFGSAVRQWGGGGRRCRRTPRPAARGEPASRHCVVKGLRFGCQRWRRRPGMQPGPSGEPRAIIEGWNGWGGAALRPADGRPLPWIGSGPGPRLPSEAAGRAAGPGEPWAGRDERPEWRGSPDPCPSGRSSCEQRFSARNRCGWRKRLPHRRQRQRSHCGTAVVASPLPHRDIRLHRRDRHATAAPSSGARPSING